MTLALEKCSIEISAELVTHFSEVVLSNMHNEGTHPLNINNLFTDRKKSLSLQKLFSSSSLRYKAIVTPMDSHRSSATLSVCLRAGVIWLLSVTLAIPEAVFSDLHTFTTSHTNETFVTCAPYPHAGELHPKIHSTASFLIFYIIPLFIISVYYCFIARSLVRSSVDLPTEGHLHLQKQV